MRTLPCRAQPNAVRKTLRCKMINRTAFGEPTGTRCAFTLIELLVVIARIATRPVAQIFNLLYRRFPIGRRVEAEGGSKRFGRAQSATLRYSRVQLCATRGGGFTLIELLVVIAIIAILAAML